MYARTIYNSELLSLRILQAEDARYLGLYLHRKLNREKHIFAH